ncbi:hypothetical protein H4R19_000638 [Coemansia spiralis]|nr:hypothetical protein H4R19_000638 [Coemansia spiralis]
MSEPGDRISKCVLERYRALPKRGKPASKGGGKQEWTVLAGIVVEDTSSDSLECVALGTGLKCLHRKQLSRFGDRVHDSHAEIVARRAFCAYLAGELRSPTSSVLVGAAGSGTHRLRDGLRIHLYTSQCPCGDASVSTPPDSDDRPGGCGSKRRRVEASTDTRGHQDPTALGILRTKPGRTDAVPTLSMSCSDKIARWNVLGVQGSLLALHIAPIYLNSVVIGGQFDPAAVDRALNQRIADIDRAHLPAGFRVNCCTVVRTVLPFEHSRTAVGASAITADASLCWLAGGTAAAALVNGAKQGAPPPPQARCLAASQRPAICKLTLFTAIAELPRPELADTYRQAKQQATDYQAAKEALLGLPRFGDWVQCPAEFEQFDRTGCCKPPPPPAHD